MTTMDGCSSGPNMRQVAEGLGLPYATMQRWVGEGVLPGWRLNDNKRHNGFRSPGNAYADAATVLCLKRFGLPADAIAAAVEQWRGNDYAPDRCWLFSERAGSFAVKLSRGSVVNMTNGSSLAVQVPRLGRSKRG